MTKAIIYARCSTDEARQDVEIQLKELRQYCEAWGWDYDEEQEYGSGYKGKQPKLEAILEKVRNGDYRIFIVYSLDRFSREHPKKVSRLLDTLVYDYKCRFISKMEGIDSDNEMIWHVIRPMFGYFAHVFSRNLSEKVRNGISRKKELGQYNGGRPKKAGKVSLSEIKEFYQKTNSLRKTAELYNATRYKDNRISYNYVRRALVGAI